MSKRKTVSRGKKFKFSQKIFYWRTRSPYLLPSPFSIPSFRVCHDLYPFRLSFIYVALLVIFYLRRHVSGELLLHDCGNMVSKRQLGAWVVQKRYCTVGVSRWSVSLPIRDGAVKKCNTEMQSLFIEPGGLWLHRNWYLSAIPDRGIPFHLSHLNSLCLVNKTNFIKTS